MEQAKEVKTDFSLTRHRLLFKRECWIRWGLQQEPEWDILVCAGVCPGKRRSVCACWCVCLKRQGRCEVVRARANVKRRRKRQEALSHIGSLKKKERWVQPRMNRSLAPASVLFLFLCHQISEFLTFLLTFLYLVNLFFFNHQQQQFSAWKMAGQWLQICAIDSITLNMNC